MITAKCKCTSCKLLVERWVDDKCIGCYNKAISAPLQLEMDSLRIENDTFRKENLNLREVYIESNQLWSSIVESYRSRYSVRATDWVMNTIEFIIGFIRLFSIGGGMGFRNLLPWQKK